MPGDTRENEPSTKNRLAHWGVLTAVLAHRPAGVPRVALGLVTVAALGVLWAAPSSGPPLAMETPTNPPANIPPNPNFLSSGPCSGSPGTYACANPCVTASLTWPVFTRDVACTTYVLSAINNARVRENLAPMVLPSNWASLSTAQQMLVVTDLERVARGYPPYLGLNANLNREALVAASRNVDPYLASGFATGFDALGKIAWGASWSGGFSVLASDYIMIYDDGWGGSRSSTANVDCTSPAAPGCWAHRDELLGSAGHFNPGVGLWCDTCEFGAAYTLVGGQSSFAQLIEMPAGPPPSMTFTWQSELASFPAGAIGAVKTISLSRVSFSGTTLRALWKVSGAQNVSLVAIYAFAGTSCAHVGGVSSFRYVPSFNILRSTVTVSSNVFARRGPYSGVVRVFTPAGSLTSRCVVLGRN